MAHKQEALPKEVQTLHTAWKSFMLACEKAKGAGYEVTIGDPDYDKDIWIGKDTSCYVKFCPPPIKAKSWDLSLELPDPRTSEEFILAKDYGDRAEYYKGYRRCNGRTKRAWSEGEEGAKRMTEKGGQLLIEDLKKEDEGKKQKRSFQYKLVLAEVEM